MRPDTHVVFVHGLLGPFGDESAFWELEPAACSAPDLDGYGGSAGMPVSVAGQVDALRRHIHALRTANPVHLVAHSIGAVYAFTLTDESPELVETVTTVEGNFSLADAFWSRSIAAMSEADARASIEERLAAPDEFLSSDGIEPTGQRLALAKQALAFQPWRAVWESARAVVECTGDPAYSTMLRRVFVNRPVHLVAGERSTSGWDVPDWARTAAASSTTLSGVGHMMMLERPVEFGRAIAQTLSTC